MLDKTKGRPSDAIVLLKQLVGDQRWLRPDQANQLNRELRGLLANATLGMSPIEISMAIFDWLGHLAISPGKLFELSESLLRKSVELSRFNIDALLSKDGLPGSDSRRMKSEAWQRWPFNVLAHGHELGKAWASELTTGIEGVRPEHEAFVEFLARQVAELLSPANVPALNPDVIETTRKERGANLVRGTRNFIDDRRRIAEGEPLQGHEEFQVGKQLAITPGKVIYENELIELIQYQPATERVGAEPVLIIPAWIMKFYILDLTPDASLVRFLIEQGHTVFIVSWKNPTAAERNLQMDDYLHSGVMNSIDAVTTITGAPKFHAVGYCLGGTLLSIAAAYMAREGDDRMQSMSLFASQIDFRDAGEIALFLGDSALSFLEARMGRKGYLDIESMVNAFTSLRVADLVYAPAVDRYLLGKDRKLNGLMAWNEDGTRMPCRMHAEYLRTCYLDNDFAEGRYLVRGVPVCVGDIRVPTFLLGTVTDHVAPWQSVYKARRLMNNEMTIVLTTGGHNAGIACGPDHPRRSYQMAVRKPGDLYVDPDRWAAETESNDGSWWRAWSDWLVERTSGDRKPPQIGASRKGYKVLRDAPGRYVFE
ncbi:MAG: PHA/PHB synthase family protein [Gammaproteobacteria bacterium]